MKLTKEQLDIIKGLQEKQKELRVRLRQLHNEVQALERRIEGVRVTIELIRKGIGTV